ncbi:MAG: preprotein translocase subunit SecG [Deltaproteobacteria bacterium]|nr:preprotein translocase subunit SecG [Deltaproteobacteria bacterium]
MAFILILLHVSVCIALILIVLLQTGKGADMGAAFGGSSQALFGSSGATSFMHKITAAAAIIFVLTCMGLTLHFGKGDTSSVMEDVSQTEAPVAEEIPTSDVQPQDAQPQNTQPQDTQPQGAPETQTDE